MLFICCHLNVTRITSHWKLHIHVQTTTLQILQNNSPTGRSYLYYKKGNVKTIGYDINAIVTCMINNTQHAHMRDHVNRRASK